ncbi:efflux RND transporter periplasmic adaptor subunit [Thermosulfurimonas sp. F29]|uniref:efflux RND transporter periplasmic adaptor subunit n=1 Tax=Thermosulfurimonas sp. F29 TaxID=2867247 RepID=UPI001C832BF0|nr:efflux RND transporter periplasmic adaptor subunit [Thermosulfurimonas sp. F29]MBX6422112.1 efflux RND transporter periplasmic adaptor subunit [Thermosulfurimonas sp. F29]
MRPAVLWLTLWLLFSPGVGLSARKTIYICPMHPSYKSDRPGKCPICGMDLVPASQVAVPSAKGERRKGEKAPGTRKAPRERAFPLVPVRISPERQQLIGVRTAPVSHQRLVLTLRAPARVAYDETRIFEVHTRVAGWVEEVRVDWTGRFVRRGETLFTLYSPRVLATEEELLRALRWLDELKETRASPEALSTAREALRAAERRLRLWGFPESALALLKSKRKPLRAFPVVAPVSGFVIKKTVFTGKRITPAEPLYTLADLSRVWIEADFYETEIPEIKPGLEVEVFVPGVPRSLRARIEEVYPWVEDRLRVMRARLTLDNPGGRLKPGMWAEVRVRIPLGMKMVIPDEALIYGGGHYYVFVKKGPGLFEPRMVRVGRKVDGKRIVLSGLRHGEEVVVSANFLIDAESRLKAALSAFGGGGGGHAGH